MPTFSSFKAQPPLRHYLYLLAPDKSMNWWNWPVVFYAAEGVDGERMHECRRGIKSIENGDYIELANFYLQTHVHCSDLIQSNLGSLQLAWRPAQRGYRHPAYIEVRLWNILPIYCRL